jgi:hypothetical protein
MRAGDRSRTRDILITSEALYQLSYTGSARRAGPGHASRRETAPMRVRKV